MEEDKSLVIRKDVNPVVFFDKETGYMEKVFSEVELQIASFTPDLSTAKGRKEIASFARKISSTKTYLEGLGVELVSEWKAKSKAVDQERRTIKDRFDTLRDRARKPLTDWENAEKDRVSKHEDSLMKIRSLLNESFMTSSEIKDSINTLESFVADESLEEFMDQAILLKEQVMEYLVEEFDAKVRLEDEERERISLEKKRVEEEKARREAEIAEKARLEAEQKANEKARIEKERVEKEKRDAELKAIEEKNKILREKEIQEALAKKAEQDKIDAEKRAFELEKKYEAEKKEAEERAKREAKEAEIKAIKEKKEYEERLAEEAKKKEDDRIAEENRVKKQIALEEEKKEQEEERRIANSAHRARIKDQMVDQIVADTGLERDAIVTLVKMISDDRILNLKIIY